jgi:hypothetical protein
MYCSYLGISTVMFKWWSSLNGTAVGLPHH